MIKLNLSFYYQAGLEIGRLANMPIGATRLQIAMQANLAQGFVRVLTGNPDMPLRACRAQGASLSDAINAMHTKMQTYIPTSQDVIPEAWSTPITWEDKEFNDVINRARTFETVLKADLDTLASYYVERKGIYDTDLLILEAQQALPMSMIRYLDAQTVQDIKSSGRCLALDSPTASGFHILRATESILYRYYTAVCKPEDEKKLENWGAYLSALYKASGGEKKVTDPEVREVYNIVTRIKGHRNNIMHPEMVLTQDQAFTLFENAKSAIMIMLSRLAMAETHAEPKESPA